HTVLFQSVVDSIELSHQAYSRDGFATGAVWAAEKILQLPSGWYSFQELF
ncbi:MAG: 4-hydroxy-tetrahydrodipicolinate reductase, partial [Bacteroidia bacterium]|nr:4-hydroxy-tetrahydrodipicolinate reductase [Bacteroidia bacterium]